MSGGNIYVYGVVESADFELDVDGVAGASEVRTVDYRDLSAVVSDVDTTEPERTDEDAEAHDRVLQAVLERNGGTTVVPMGYGMAFESTRTLKNVLRGARVAFRRALNDVEGTVELGVKIVRDEGSEVDEEAVRETVAERLDPLSVNAVDNDLFTDRLVLNRAYLVERDDREAFDEAVGDLEEELDDDLALQYTGPWAPYNFVDIHVGAEQ